MPSSLLLFMQKDCEAQLSAFWTQGLQTALGGVVVNAIRCIAYLKGANQTFGDNLFEEQCVSFKCKAFNGSHLVHNVIETFSLLRRFAITFFPLGDVGV